MKCSLCGAEGTNRTTCPLNSEALTVDRKKHALRSKVRFNIVEHHYHYQVDEDEIKYKKKEKRPKGVPKCKHPMFTQKYPCYRKRAIFNNKEQHAEYHMLLQSRHNASRILRKREQEMLAAERQQDMERKRKKTKKGAQASWI